MSVGGREGVFLDLYSLVLDTVLGFRNTGTSLEKQHLAMCYGESGCLLCVNNDSLLLFSGHSYGL